MPQFTPHHSPPGVPLSLAVPESKLFAQRAVHQVPWYEGNPNLGLVHNLGGVSYQGTAAITILGLH